MSGMKFSITTLIENSAVQDHLATEHGLSFFIERPNFQVLYDTGASPRFLKNAKELDVDVCKADALVLSHGHYDHTGGAVSYLAESEVPMNVYLGDGFFRERYAKRRDGILEISALISEKHLQRLGVSVQIVRDEPLMLADGMWIMGGFTPNEQEERLSSTMLCRIGCEYEQDAFTDEIVLVLETEEELAVISGCSHVGAVNICRTVSGKFGRPVTMFIGGTHLMDADEERIQWTCGALRDLGIQRLGACHCNGETAGRYFEQHFPGFFRNQTGTNVKIR